MAEQQGLMGIYVYLDDLVQSIEKLRREKIPIKNVYSPMKHAKILEAMGTKPSGVRLVSLIAGILGGLFGLALASWSHLRWGMITWGKPILPWIPWVVVFFELLILISVLSTVAALLIKGRLPKIRYGEGGYSPKFSGDRFGIELYGGSGEMEKARGIMKESGAEEIHDIES